MIFLTIKALHIIATFSWFAAIMYLPRLFVYHSQTKDKTGRERFCAMERRLYKIIANPAMMVTILLGGILTSFHSQYMLEAWWIIKVFCVFLLVLYQLACKKYMLQLAANTCKKNHKFFRNINEIPLFIIIIIIFCVTLKTL